MSLARPGPGFRLSALYAASFAGLGVSMPFFPLWLEHRGLGASTIGMVLAVPIVVRTLAIAPVMTLIDRGVGARRLMIVAHLALASVYLALGAAEGPAAIAMLVAVMALAQTPIFPTADLVALDAVRRHPGLDYGRVRLWGSITFLCASVAAGYGLGTRDLDRVIAILTGLAVVGMVVSWLAIPADRGAAGVEDTTIGEGDDRTPASLRFVVAAAALIQASHAAVYAFGSIHWRETGVSSVAIGYLWAVGVVAEVAVFAAFGKVVGRGRATFGFLALGAAAAVVRFAAMAFEPGLAATTVLQALHGLSFGMTHLGTIAALAWLAPPTGRARAQGVLGGALACANAAATVLSGLVFRNAGPWVFLAMVPLAAAGLACALLAARADARQPHKAGEGG